MDTRNDLRWARSIPARAVRVGLHLAGLGVLGLLVGRPRIEGADRLRQLEGPVVIAANHSSHLDTPYLLSCLPLRHRHNTVVVAAADYFYSSAWKATAVSLAFGTIPVERKGEKSKSTARIHRLLDQGWNIMLYPEGTRSRDATINSLHKGAAMLAEQHHAPLVPVGIHGTHEALPPGSRWPRRYPITVRIGEPVPWRSDVETLTKELDERLHELSGRD